MICLELKIYYLQSEPGAFDLCRTKENKNVRCKNALKKNKARTEQIYTTDASIFTLLMMSVIFVVDSMTMQIQDTM